MVAPGAGSAETRAPWCGKRTGDAFASVATRPAGPEEGMKISEYAQLVRFAVGDHVERMQHWDVGEDLVGIAFVHKAQQSKMMVVVDAADERTPVDTVALVVVIAPWEDVVKDPEAMFQLYSLNTRLMSCALSVMPVAPEQNAVVLVRRVPITELPPDRVLEWIDSMQYEFASHAGLLEDHEHADSDADGDAGGDAAADAPS